VLAFVTLRLTPARAFRGRFSLAGDKSISHRAAILGAVAPGDSTIRNFSTAADCASTLRCLEGLGVGVRRQGATVVVAGRGFDGLNASESALDAGNSGSTLRMLAGLLAGRPFESVLTGDESLRRRPVERVAEPLRRMGARLASRDGRPPLRIHGGPLHGISWDMPVASAQVKTAILLAGLQADGATTVREPARSRDHTERLLPAFGVPVRIDRTTVTVEGGTPLRPVDLAVPGDVSSAAFLVVAALVLPGSEVRIENVLLNPGRVAFVDVLRAMRGDVAVEVTASGPEPVGWIEARSSALRAVDIPPTWVPALIDELPALAVAACFAEGCSTVAGAAELRVKESDRIGAIVEGLAALGARIQERPDGFAVEGGSPLRGALVRSRGDHRIAMALAVAALAAEGATEIEGGDCVGVSFPEFPRILAEATA
jgi:3-phosphoshikimate 1-carboxyvinyltransferase